MLQYGIYDPIKRMIEIFLALFLILLLIPLFLVIGFLVLLSTKKNPIFVQRRVTKDGRVFPMYKFRSMRDDIASSDNFTRPGDPRITRVGRVLRRTRLDELPQLLNILTGDMSFIGPRPERPELIHELAAALPHFHQRLSVPAGLTGLAQVHVGYAGSMQKYRHKLNCDLLYIRHRCFLLDAWILLKTVSVVIGGKGAC